MTPIQGFIYSNDRTLDATFDAEPWLEQATDEEIIALGKANFGSPEADDVARYAESEGDKYVKAVLDYHRHSNSEDNPGETVGLTTEIDPNAATAWIREHRPHLSEKLEA